MSGGSGSPSPRRRGAALVVACAFWCLAAAAEDLQELCDVPRHRRGALLDLSATQGFHRTIEVRFDGALPLGGGAVAVAQLVPAGAFIDLDEVRHRHDFAWHGHISVLSDVPFADVEAPASKAHPYVVLFVFDLLDPPGDSGGISFRIPLHLRYQPPVDASVAARPFGQVTVRPPMLIPCKDAKIHAATLGAASWEGLRKDLERREDASSDLELRAPAGNVAHEDMVALGTLGAMLAGCLWILWVVCSVSQSTAAARGAAQSVS
mmetsp:Transcript_39278/g.122955  ORF Transcript_39278/g.122955 Transcript_39278/m.122955 type:complete len:264 (+) Transcript_39278:226-1017(+)